MSMGAVEGNPTGEDAVSDHYNFISSPLSMEAVYITLNAFNQSEGEKRVFPFI